MNDSLMVFKYQGKVFQVILDRQPQYWNIKTAFGSGKYPKDSQWPSLCQQWSNVAAEVAEYKALTGLIEENNKPDYPNHIAGMIPDDGIKPYEIKNNIALVVPGRMIICRKL